MQPLSPNHPMSLDRDAPSLVPFDDNARIENEGISQEMGSKKKVPAGPTGYSMQDTLNTHPAAKVEVEKVATEEVLPPAKLALFSWLPSLFSWLPSSAPAAPEAPQVATPNQNVKFIEEAHTEAIELLKKASIDNISAIFFAHALINHTVTTALSSLNQRAKDWSYQEAHAIQGTYGWGPHIFNILGGAIQAGAGGYAIYAQAQALPVGITYHDRITKIQVDQQAGSAFGGFAQQGHGVWSGKREGDRSVAQAHQGALSTDRQNAGQEVSQSKQSVTGGLERLHATIQQKSEAIASMTR